MKSQSDVKCAERMSGAPKSDAPRSEARAVKRSRGVSRVLSALVVGGVLASGCVPPQEPPKPPPVSKPILPEPLPTAIAKAPERELPPASGVAKEVPLPAPVWDELANGLKVATITAAALPIVQLRVVVLAGSAQDGDKPGLASITGDLLKDGGAGNMTSRELVSRVEGLGSSLDISTGFDRTTLAMAVMKDQFAEAMELVGTVVQKPAMSAAEMTKLKKRAVDAASDRARTDGGWAASMMLYRGLFGGAPAHPYATYDATATDLGKLTVGDCKAFHKKLFVPKNMFVVVAGDVTRDEAKAAADKTFGAMTGGDAPALAFPAVTAPDHLTITLVDRPKSTQSEVFAGVLGPERTAADWPAFSAANQVLGGGVASRLFLEVREKASLAYRANSWLQELAHGPSLLVAYVATQSNKTGLAVKALLEQMERLGTTEPTAEETATATRFLSDVSAIKLETVGSLANELAKNRTLGLPDDYPVAYRRAVREITGAQAAKAVAERVRAGRTALVVAGDAKVIGAMLSHFGEVKVVDPAKGFAVKETLAKNAEAALELPREAGK